MSKFLTRAELYLLIQRELPEDVYPHSGKPEDFLSTSESDAQSEIIANYYEKLEAAYENFFPQTADESGVALHEIMEFGRLSIGRTLSERRARLLLKNRELLSLSQTDLEELIRRELPDGTIFQIVNWNRLGEGGSWYLGESELGFDTYLGGSGSHSYPPGTDICQKDGSDVFLTPDEWSDYRTNAFTYEVRIYEYTPTDAELEELTRVLEESEAARDGRIIRTNVDPSEYVGGSLPPMVSP